MKPPERTWEVLADDPQDLESPCSQRRWLVRNKCKLLTLLRCFIFLKRLALSKGEASPLEKAFLYAVGEKGMGKLNGFMGKEASKTGALSPSPASLEPSVSPEAVSVADTEILFAFLIPAGD